MLIVKAPAYPFKKTLMHLHGLSKKDYVSVLKTYGQRGLDALSSATPVDSGLTASSWTFELKPTFSGYILKWNNTNESDGANVAILIQYGHGTGTGGWVQGRDYINPSIRPLFEQISAELERLVRSA